MAVFTRVSGDAKGVNVMDPGRTAGNIIATGLTKSPTIFHISANADLRGEMVTGGAVETILRAVAVDSTVVMYSVDATVTAVGGADNANLAVLVEATGTTASGLETRLQALNAGGNIGATTAITAASLQVVSPGFWLRWE